MSRTISVRFPQDLYDKVIHSEVECSTLIRKAVIQYFRSKEPNNRIDVYGHTSSYNRELVDLLNDQIQDLKCDKERLLKQNEMLMVSSIPLLSKVKLKLLGY